jgi:signal transduction histidine kinase
MLPRHRLIDPILRWVNDNWFKSHRLKIAGLIVPILVVSAIEIIYLPTIGNRYDSRLFVLCLVGASDLAVAAFGLLMFRLIDRAQVQIVNRNHQLAALVEDLDWSNKQGAAYQRILHSISSHTPIEDINTQVLHEAQTLIEIGDAPLWQNSDISQNAKLLLSIKEKQFLEGLSQLSAIAGKNVQAREFEQQSAIMMERERIAREMHDSLAQAVGATHLRLRALESHEAIKACPKLEDEIRTLADICEDAYGDVRETILGLRTSTRSEGGLLRSLEAYLSKYSKQCGIETSLVFELSGKLSLSPKFEVQILRVVQEALTNVRKHSGAKHVRLVISENGLYTSFSVEDDGEGFDFQEISASRQRYGLDIMRERLEMLSGTLKVETKVGRGTKVVASIPEISSLKMEPEAVSID